MNNSKMRTLLLCSFLFVTSLVIAKAGLTWTRNNDDASEDEMMEALEIELRVHADHEGKHDERIKRLRVKSAELQDKAERLAERIAAGVEVAIESEDFEFNFDMDDDENHGDLMISRSFDVKPGGDLDVKLPGADVQLISGSSDKIEVFVYLKGRDMEKAKAYFEDLDFQIEENGNNVSIKTNSEGGRWGWSRHGHAQVFVRAIIPQEFNADVTTSGGDISVTDLRGDLNLATSGGDIEMGSVIGTEITVTTSGGDIEAGNLGGHVRLTTSGGDIDLGSVEGPEISVRTSGGDISSGSMQAEKIDMRTSGGDIAVRKSIGRNTIKTSGGDIEVGHVSGMLEALTSGGDIDVDMDEASELTLRTTGGSIQIVGPSNLQADLDLRATEISFGRGVSFEGTKKKNMVDGAVNGGGVRISATSSGGDISLELNK